MSESPARPALCHALPVDPARTDRAEKLRQLAADCKRYGVTEIWERKVLDTSFTFLEQGQPERRREIPRWDYYM